MGFRIFFGIASLAVMALCAVNYWIELTPQWANYQREYYGRLAERVKDDTAKAKQVAATPAKFVQIYNQQLGVADRCTICHAGIDNPRMDGVKQPFKVHPSNLLNVASGRRRRLHDLPPGTGAGHDHRQRPRKGRALGHAAIGGPLRASLLHEMPPRRRNTAAPVLTRGKRLLHEMGCVGCHRTGEEPSEKIGPRLAVEGSKVSRKWLQKWLMNPKDYLPRGKMPHFRLQSSAANALAAYIMNYKDKTIDSAPEPKGDAAAGKEVLGRLQCVACHVTKDDPQGNPNGIGGTIGPDLAQGGQQGQQALAGGLFAEPARLLSAHQNAPLLPQRKGG